MPTLEIKIIQHRVEYKALYRRMRDEGLLKYLCLSYNVDTMQDEEWWVAYLSQEHRLILAGFIDKDFVGCMMVTPFGNFYSNAAEFGICCVRKWIRKREEIRQLFRMGVHYCFDTLHADSVIACIPKPNRHARIATGEFGMRHLCTVPGMVYWADKNSFVDVDMYINTKEDMDKEKLMDKEKIGEEI